MRLLDVLECKAEQVRLIQGPVWARWWDYFMDQVGPPQEDRQTADDYLQTLRMAENFTVDTAMFDLVTAVAETLPAETEVYREDFPSLQGILSFPRPIRTRDVRGSTPTTTAITWDIYGGKLHLYYLSPVEEETRTLFSRDGAPVPSLAPWHYRGQTLGKPLPEILSLSQEVPREVGDKIKLTRSGVEEGFKITLELPPELRDENGEPTVWLAPEIDPVFRWFFAALKLMGQSLTTATDMHVPRPTLRRLQRLNLNTKATVIALRRREYHGDGDGSREYSHRFLRRGHWRRQPYKEERGGEWRYKTIYIHPTIVGDPDLPLIVREHVSALLR